MQVVQTRKFETAVKKLHKNQKEFLFTAIKQLIENPSIGQEKKGDLSGIRVYKYKMSNQEILLAYSYDSSGDTLTLLRFGSHQNFYRDLKTDIN